MRIGVVRTDLGKGIYLADLESKSQRVLSASTEGQAMTLKRPSDDDLSAVLASYPLPVYLTASNTSATVDTSTNDTLRVRVLGSDAFTEITVTGDVALTKTDIRDELNAAFLLEGLPFISSVVGTNQIRVDTISPNLGPSARLEIDSVANGSTLSTAIGINVAGVVVSGSSLTTVLGQVKTAVYPTGTTIDVSSDIILGANASFTILSSQDKIDLVAAIADLVAPTFVETGLTLLSFSHGVISKLRSSSYRPDGDRVGLPTGAAVAVVEDDGSTVFTYL